jgi:phenylacetate-CoA ligase
MSAIGARDGTVRVPRSAISGIRWPGILADDGATMLAMQYQLERTQWWSAAELRAAQLLQLRPLVRHAFESVPFYRERFERCGIDPRQKFDFGDFERLPLLKRADLQGAPTQLQSTQVPPEHGPVTDGYTSGSTGAPVHFYTTSVCQFFWRALTLRHHLWHERDLGAKFGAIRITAEEGLMPGWGSATDVAFVTGPGAQLGFRADIDTQLTWLHQQRPRYLLSYPSNILALVRRSVELRMPALPIAEVLTFGEMLPADLRAAVRAAWDAPVTDAYSSQEVGYIALQCPQCEHYHVQAEGMLVEVLDNGGKPCAPGQTGEVVVTDLHNLAMPLIRYRIGDFATVGEACGCGRGLPVLTRIVGRVRNMLVMPDGALRFPRIGTKELSHIAPILQHQLVQKAPDCIEVNLVVAQALSEEAQERVGAAIRQSLGYPFRLMFRYHASIERSASGKFEDFISEVARTA